MAAEVAAHLHAGASIQRGKWFVEQKPVRWRAPWRGPLAGPGRPTATVAVRPGQTVGASAAPDGGPLVDPVSATPRLLSGAVRKRRYFDHDIGRLHRRHCEDTWL
jgi:hypothetical protein